MKHIFISGTSKGIGRALAEHFLEQGYRVSGCARSNSDLNHEHYFHYKCDMLDGTALSTTVRHAISQAGPVYALINNAGMASMNHFLTTPDTSAKNIFDLNVLAAARLTQLVSKSMVRNGGGRIVNFSSVAVALRLEGESVYAASKAAIESLTRTLAKELSPYKITVNCIAPTPIQTDLIKAVPKDKIDSLVNQQAIKRLGLFSDVANAADFFISEKSSFISGQILYLGGVS